MEELILLFKALSDQNRLKIVNILSKDEICACKILEKLNITQATLSHHMKILCECGLVNGRKKGIWMHYYLNREKFDKLFMFINEKKQYIIEKECER